MKLKDIAERLGGRLEGDGEIEVRGVAGLEEAGPADLTFIYGAPSSTPIAGDWDGDGTDTVGTFQSGTASWFLRNSNTSGNADVTFIYGAPGQAAIAGDWDGN